MTEPTAQKDWQSVDPAQLITIAKDVRKMKRAIYDIEQIARPERDKDPKMEAICKKALSAGVAYTELQGQLNWFVKGWEGLYMPDA